MKKNILILFIIWVLYSCNSKIPIPQMANVLLDVSVAMNYTQEQIMVQKITDTNIIMRMKEKVLDTICAIYKISPEELKYSFNYYVNRPPDMQIILDSINQKSTRLSNQYRKPPSSVK